MRASLNQRFENAFEHDFRLLQHFVVPEPDYAKPEPGEAARPFELFERVLVVLTSIQFHDQTSSQTHEVGDVRPQGNLSAKAVAG